VECKLLIEVLSALPADFPAAIAVVQHISPKYPSHLSEIFSRRTRLLVKPAEEGEVFRAGSVYIAVTDKHLMVNSNGNFSLFRYGKS
jgi:two-component system chemotaxis response regulator CheB